MRLMSTKVAFVIGFALDVANISDSVDAIR